MRVFVTGATGFIGSAVVKELIDAGHQVTGVYRSDDKAPALAAAGAEVYRGSIDDPDSLKDGAARSDGIIHLAFNHDFSQFAANCETDRRVIKALGSVLTGSDRPLIVTSGTAIAKVAPGGLALEDGSRDHLQRLPPRRFRRGDCWRRRGWRQHIRCSLAPGSRPRAAGAYLPLDRDRQGKGNDRLCRRGT
jgi:NAD(P)-dependent dehydrogenase (short-subunit alcohol dehydrogenase family)